MLRCMSPFSPHFAERNLKRNNLQADVCPMGVGLGYPVYLHKECGATGLHVGSIIVKTRCISEVLNEDDYDLAKFDCEGCEYSLLLASREDINRVNKYIVECHGSPMLLYGKFKECGFRVKHSGVKFILKLPNSYKIVIPFLVELSIQSSFD
jgi:hypothetical protein